MKTALITGAYGAIGREIAIGLVKQNYRILLVGRKEKRLNELKEELQSNYVNSQCQVYIADISLKAGIQKLADSIDEKIHVLINNAATAPVQRIETEEGIEMQWATNVLGYYWMIMAFHKQLLRTSNPRIVNVASYWAGDLDLEDPEFKTRIYNNNVAYRQSKQADRMLTYGLTEFFKGTIAINSCHPGDTNSKLSNDLGFGGSESAKKAAETPLLLATTDLGLEYNGQYFEHGKISNCRFQKNESAIDQLLEICEQY